MTVDSKCPACRANVLQSDRFCGECGADLSASLAKPVAQRTMLGLPPQARSESEPAALPAAAVPAAPPPELPPSPKKPAAQATLLGLPAPEAPASVPATGLGKGTMRGVAPPSDGSPPAGPGAAARPAPAPDAPARKDTPKRTLLGGVVAAVRGRSPGPAKRPIPAISDRTILGMQSAVPGAEDAQEPGEDPYDDEPPVLDAALPATLRRAGLVAGGVLLALGALWLLGGRDNGVGARVVTGAAGDELEIAVPDAPDGTKLRFAGKEALAKAGKARFPLSADSLHIGSNELGISVIDADGSASETSLSLEVDYRARFELASLGDANPTATFVLDALPGSRVQVGGKPLALDAKGHGQQAVAVAPGGAAARDLTVKFRLEPPEKAAIDAELKAQLPAASVLLESPSDGLITEAKQLKLSGSVGNDTRVTVAGAEASVSEGHFERQVELGAVGETQIAVVARAPGKAPRVASLRVERVQSLALAAGNFSADRSITYAVLAKDPAALRGKNVAFDGRVYNVEVHAGRTVLQVLVNDCPRGERCPLWVELGEQTSFAKDGSVRVLGTVAGEQQFRSKQGAVQAVPSVRASFVIRTTGK